MIRSQIGQLSDIPKGLDYVKNADVVKILSNHR